MLLKATEATVRENGGELLEINVDGEDTDARRFYERHGYTNHDPRQTQPQLYYHRDLVYQPCIRSLRGISAPASTDVVCAGSRDDAAHSLTSPLL